MPSKKRGLNKGLNTLLAETLGAVPVVKVNSTIEAKTAKEEKESKVELKTPSKVNQQVTSATMQISEVKRQVVATAPLVHRRVVAPTSPLASPLDKGIAVSKNAEKIVLESKAAQSQAEKEYVWLGVNKLTPGRYQPRKSISEDELEELSISIKAHGLLQPVVVRKLKDQQYEIIAGERRWRASQLAGLTEIPVIIKKITDEEACAIGLVENIQRQALNSIEEAIGIDMLIKKFELTHAEVATTVGKSRTAITNLLRLLNLQSDVKQMLASGEIDLGHAKVLLTVSGSKQSVLAHKVVENKLSVRETEALVATRELEPKASSRSKRPMDPDVKRLQQRLSEKLGAAVKIQHGVKGKGKVVIHYNSLETLDGILAKIDLEGVV